MNAGIDAIGFYGGRAFVDVRNLAHDRGLDSARFENLLMERKTVSLPFEDPVSFAVNAARPIMENLTREEKATIDLLILATESGLDFGKSLSTYVHHYLGLSRQCRLFEIKQACFGGTAALQTACAHVSAPGNQSSRALVICTDVARPVPHTYAEPSQGAAALALLIKTQPRILELEPGARGNWSYEVMDSCRPTSEIEIGDPDLSLLVYLECLENSYRAYQAKIGELHLMDCFQGLAFHTPFGGMVRGGHRALLRKFTRAAPHEIEADFARRVQPSLQYCKQVGNIYSGALYLALCGLIDHSQVLVPGSRIGLFSYGSGCCSEFFSGLLQAEARGVLRKAAIAGGLQARTELSMQRYDELLARNRELKFGETNHKADFATFADLYEDVFHGQGLLVLTGIDNYHRSYAWT